jgi:hypothetical protein
MSYQVLIWDAFKSILYVGLFWLLNSPHGHWGCHPTNRRADGSPPWITPWVAAVMTVPLQPWHLCPAWIKIPLPVECWRTLKSPSVNSAGVEPSKAFTCHQESGLLKKDVMLHNHAHPSNTCTVGDLTCSMCWNVVHLPYSPDLFIMWCPYVCVCGLQVSEALEPGCMKMLRPPWCSDFSSSQSSSATGLVWQWDTCLKAHEGYFYWSCFFAQNNPPKGFIWTSHVTAVYVIDIL